MTHKRSRNEFEAELQAHQSPFASFGVPNPPVDDEVRDDGSYVPVWQQTVTDERGRKRLHGAFTGGFSAGYFNTVGSKEGWTPSTFVSSRTNRRKDQPDAAAQRPEDFMDDEDLAAVAEDRKLHTAQAFAGLGQSDTGAPQLDLLGVPRHSETAGTKLLHRMGWRQGQGIGPKILRQARLEDQHVSAQGPSTHLFAPEDSHVHTFTLKTDRKGFGQAEETSLSLRSKVAEEDDEDEPFKPFDLFAQPQKPRKLAKKTATKKTGFGVGVLNDNGSDDEDPYAIGPKLSFNKILGKEKKLKKLTPSSSDHVGTTTVQRPVYVKKGRVKQKEAIPVSRACHDGRLPLRGFVLSTISIGAAMTLSFPPPKIPLGWKSSRSSQPEVSAGTYQSVVDAAKASKLDSVARANLLGETQLRGKSVWDYVSKGSRDRIAAITGNDKLPQARGEAPPEQYRKSAEQLQKDMWQMIPQLDKQIASAALHGGGFMPYAEDLEKRARYVSFLALRAGSSNKLPERAPTASVSDWAQELREFAQAAAVFRPSTGIMASRFTSASSSFVSGGTEHGKNEDNLVRTLPARPEDAAVQAAKLGMYGPMTRSIFEFFPSNLLCKRFAVQPPPSAVRHDQKRTTEAVDKHEMDKLFREAQFHGPTMHFPDEPRHDQSSSTTPVPLTQAAKVNVEVDAVLGADKPAEDVFKSVFGSDDED